MASIFDSIGNGIKGLFGEGFGDRAAIAQAIIDGDYAGAGQLRANQREAASQAEKNAAEQAAMQQVFSQIDRDPGLSDQDRVYAKGNPKAYLDHYMSRFDTQKFDAGGGSIGTRNADGSMSYSMAPSERVIDDAIIRTDANGQSRATYESPYPKIIPGQDGAFNEQPRLGVAGINGMGAAPPPNEGNAVFQPGEVVNGFRFKGGNDEDPANWEKIGGPTPGGSGGFPF